MNAMSTSPMALAAGPTKNGRSTNGISASTPAVNAVRPRHDHAP